MAHVTSYRWIMENTFEGDTSAIPGLEDFTVHGTWTGGGEYRLDVAARGEPPAPGFIFSERLEATLGYRDGQWEAIVYHALPLIPRIMGRGYREELPEFDTVQIDAATSDPEKLVVTAFVADSADPRNDATYTIEIDAATFRLLTLSQTSTGNGTTYTMTTTFTDYNAPLTIDYPTEWTPLPEGYR